MGLSGCVTGNNCPARYQVSHPSGGLKKGNFNGSSSVCGNLATYRTAKHRERYTSLWSFTSQLSTSQIVSQQSQLVEDRSASSRENLEREREKKLRLRFIREREKLITKLENGLSKHENRSEAAASAAYRFTFWGVSGGSLSVRRLAAEEGT